MKNEIFKKNGSSRADIFTEIFGKYLQVTVKTCMQKDLHWNVCFANYVELR